MFVNFHEMYKTTKAIRFVAARFPLLKCAMRGEGNESEGTKGNKEEINRRSIIVMRISCPGTGPFTLLIFYRPYRTLIASRVAWLLIGRIPLCSSRLRAPWGALNFRRNATLPQFSVIDIFFG